MVSAGAATRVLAVVAVFVVIGVAQEEPAVPRTPNLHPRDGVTFTPSPTTSVNIPAGGLAACAGEVVATESAPVGEQGGLTLQVHRSVPEGGRTCATVTKTGTAAAQRGELSVTLRLHNYDGRRWPRYAEFRHKGTKARSPAIYLDRTDGRCVRAEARFDPERGRAVALDTGKIGCRWDLR